ncbi:GNAT family N-acetyltransferase [Aureispira sp. CCB-E]|uniref:GNAT family N-acetyltransferase n=1 Tax=Aureispira sp. CCB-E TaxID=3051121 RepID=UPI0028690F68|nr:GNAT family N-acetyltransferase [Aureispira sp. CCB-E]WMX15212.1 GNAT family N-acetyltransferase [Aureispira sp. CCB-E]
MNVEFVDFDRMFLGYSWKWLNDPEIKRLTNSSSFTKEEQEEWYNSLESISAHYFIKGVCLDNKPIGITGLKNISSREGEYWGYIGEKEHWGKGIGTQMLEYIMKKGKEDGLERIYLKVSLNNDRAISLYKKLGFIVVEDIERQLKSELYMEYKY